MQKFIAIISAIYIGLTIVMTICIPMFVILAVCKLCGVLDAQWIGVCVPLLMAIACLPIVLPCKAFINIKGGK